MIKLVPRIVVCSFSFDPAGAEPVDMLKITWRGKQIPRKTPHVLVVDDDTVTCGCFASAPVSAPNCSGEALAQLAIRHPTCAERYSHEAASDVIAPEFGPLRLDGIPVMFIAFGSLRHDRAVKEVRSIISKPKH